MVDTKISALTAASAAAGANEFAINESGTSKKISLTQLINYLRTVGLPTVTRLSSQHSVSSTTGTKVTALDQNLLAGTYHFIYALMVQSANTADGPQLGIDFTGTAAVKNFIMRWGDEQTAIGAQVYRMASVGSKTIGYIDGMAHNAYTTTAPNMGTTVGVESANTNVPCFIEGVIIVTVSGDLQLYEAAESTNAATVEAGSSLIVTRTV